MSLRLTFRFRVSLAQALGEKTEAALLPLISPTHVASFLSFKLFNLHVWVFYALEPSLVVH